MKVLHVISTLGVGGAEKLLVDIVRHFQKTGSLAEVYVLKKTNSFFEESLEKLCRVTYGSGDVYSIRSCIELYKYLRRNEYDIVHTHLTAPQLYLALFNRFFPNYAIMVTTEHNTYNRRRGFPAFKYLDRLIYARLHAIVCITKATSESLNSWLPETGTKTFVIENGIDYKAFSGASAAQLECDRPILISVARFSEQKDQDTIIRALKSIAFGTLLLVGDGERKGQLQSLVKEHGLENRVVFLGNRSDIPELLKASDIFIQSSHWEGFGLSTAEAMAAGLPVIASRLPGLKDVVGDAGILFTPGDENELVLAIVSLSNPEKRLKMGNLASARANRFDIEHTVRRYNALYDLLVLRRNQRVRQ